MTEDIIFSENLQMSLNESNAEDTIPTLSGQRGTKPTAISLFAGAGGCSLGFQQAGFDIRFATDIDRDAVESYRRNFAGTPCEVANGLFRLTKPGYKVFTASDLIASGYPGAAAGEIYAVFEVEPDPAYSGRKWDEAEVTKQIKAFESRRNYRQVDTLNRRSPDPRVLSLQELLRAMR